MLVFWTHCKDEVFREVIDSTLRGVGSGIKYRKETCRLPDKSKGENFKPKLYHPKKGEFVLAMGVPELEAMKREGFLPKKNKTVGSARGLVTRLDGGGVWMNSYDPGIVKVDMFKNSDVRWDIKLIERLERTGSLDPEIGDYEWVGDFSEVIQYIKDKYDDTGRPVDVAGDLETMGLIPWEEGKKIVSASFTVEEGQAQAAYTLGLTGKKRELISKQLKWILTTPKVSMKGANFKYDLIWIRVEFGIICTNFKMDTLLVGSLINENRSNSLKNHACEYTSLGGYDASFDDKYDKARMEMVPQDDPDFLTYVGGDTDACLRVSNVFRKHLKNERNLQHFYVKILHPAARAFEEIEYHGLCVDQKEYRRVRREVSKEIDDCTKKLIDMMPRKIRFKYADKDNLLTPRILKEFLFTPSGLNLKPKMFTKGSDKKEREGKEKEPTIAYDHLMMFRDNPDAKEFIAVYKTLNAANKTRSTYIDGFLKHIRPDGRFHPTYALYNGDLFGYGNDKDDSGTDTGRTSAKNPAIQTLPKKTKWAKALRRCYVTPAGYTLFQIDFNQGELRIAACLAEEENMIEAYNKGLDLHAVTAAGLSGYEINEFMSFKENENKKAVFDTFRGRAKAANFGLIYGMQAPGYREYARTGYDLDLTLNQAEAERDAFFGTYPDLLTWHTGAVSKAHKDKCIVSPLGRVRHLPLIDSNNWVVRSEAERQAINSPVQGTLSDLCLWSIAEIHKRFTMEEVWLAGTTHDSIYGYIPDKYVIDRLSEMKNIIESLPITEEFGWEPQVKFLVDSEISNRNMAELEGVKL